MGVVHAAECFSYVSGTSHEGSAEGTTPDWIGVQVMLEPLTKRRWHRLLLQVMPLARKISVPTLLDTGGELLELVLYADLLEIDLSCLPLHLQQVIIELAIEHVTLVANLAHLPFEIAEHVLIRLRQATVAGGHLRSNRSAALLRLLHLIKRVDEANDLVL